MKTRGAGPLPKARDSNEHLSWNFVEHEVSAASLLLAAADTPHHSGLRTRCGPRSASRTHSPLLGWTSISLREAGHKEN